MKRYAIYAVVFLAAGLSACRKGMDMPDLKPQEEILINWGTEVKAGEDATRTLIGNPENGSDYVSLHDACADGGAMNHAIGFWTDMTYVAADGWESHRYDVFNASGGETRLTYDRESGRWIYNEGKAQYWSRGARYNFVAYYPQSMSEHVLQGSSSTSVNTFVLSYNTHNVQEDLMVAYNEVCTEDPVTKKPSIYRKYTDDTHTSTRKSSVTTTREGNPNASDAQYGFDQDFNLDSKVPLHFKHTLAAVRLRFRFDYKDEDELLECWFENTDESGFHTVGTLVFGVGSMQAEYPKEGFMTLLDQRRFEHDEKEGFAWTHYQTTRLGVKMYNWGVKKDEAGNWHEGIKFKRESDDAEGYAAVAYVPLNHKDNDGNTVSSLTAEAEILSKHNGWFLVIPQLSPGTVTLYYRLKSSTLDITPVNIPAYTGTDRYGFTEGEVRPDGSIVRREDCVYYVEGHRYVYTVTINKTNAYASVSVTPWNELRSSTEIIF